MVLSYQPAVCFGPVRSLCFVDLAGAGTRVALAAASPPDPAGSSGSSRRPTARQVQQTCDLLAFGACQQAPHGADRIRRVCRQRNLDLWVFFLKQALVLCRLDLPWEKGKFRDRLIQDS